MDYYSYPLDTKTLIRKKLSIKKELLQRDNNWINLKVAVFGGSTTKEVVDQLELALLNYGIKAEFYQSEYGKYWEYGVFGNAVLDEFHPDIIYIHTNWRNIQQFPGIGDPIGDVESVLEKEYQRFVTLWDSIREKYRCPVIQNNFERPGYRIMGNRDVWDLHGRSCFIVRLNLKLYEYAREQDSFYINDLEYIAQSYGLDEWSDALYWNMYKYICPINAIPDIAISVAHIIKSLYGRNKKLLALDLDNTLWGGVVGEDGREGLVIGEETAQGQAYLAFQRYCKELKQLGVILAVNSKNDEENALAGLNHPDGILKPDDFVAIKANWQSKDQNLKEIADELSLGMDSFVFVDDNPAEREIVKRQLPEVTVPEISSIENYIREIDRQGFFETTVVSSEDLIKTEQYKARKSIREAQDSFSDYNEFLKSLQMKAVLTGFDPLLVQRIAQLTNKTNQFNLTTKRCSEDEIRKMQESNAYICICGRLIDKFSDNGIVTVVAGEVIESELHIRIWLMSCRVLKRGLEDAMMNAIVKRSEKMGIKSIKGYYFPTAKNSMVKDFYRDMGFELCSEDEQHNTAWKMDISKYKYRDSRIAIEEEG